MPQTPVSTLLFDLDGTLVDSIPDLLASANRVMVRMGLATFGRADVVPMVGDGAGALVGRLLAARGRVATPDDLQIFIDDYMAHVADDTVPYPGIPGLLQSLRDDGWMLAVATNKPEAPARAVLERLGLAPHFAAVAGGDTFPVRKPDPRHLLLTVAQAGGTPGRAVMVGDHHNDLAAAAAAGIPSIYVPWGYGPNTGSTATVETAQDIATVAATLLG